MGAMPTSAPAVPRGTSVQWSKHRKARYSAGGGSSIRGRGAEGQRDSRVKDNLFGDERAITRADDALQAKMETGAVVSRIWHQHLKGRWKLLSVTAIAMLLSAATAGAIPELLKRSIDDIFIGKREDLVIVLTLFVIVLTIIKTASEYVSKVTVTYLGTRFAADLRILMFERIARADLRWVEGIHSGRFISSFLNDILLIRQTAGLIIVGLGENLLKVLILGGYLFFLDWRLALLIMTTMPLAVFSMRRQRKKMRKSARKTMQETGDMSALIAQTLRALRVVRAYGQEQKEIERATQTINRAQEFTMRGVRARALSGPAVELAAGFGFAAAIYVAGTRGLDGTMSQGEFTAFMAATMLMYQPLKAVATLQTALQEGVAAAGRVFGIIDRKFDTTDAPDARPLTVRSGTITFENVSFAYEKGQPVLRNFSLTVPAGKTVALVGPSGAGKSSVLALAPRFFDPQEGRILIDGQDISKVSSRSLRAATALVTQEPVIFDDTIRANIAYGRDGASNDEITEAAKAAAAHDFITALPKGYETMAGEAGNVLSGGEKQRIAIARAILKDAPILLLDEPTSALDATAEAKVQLALEQLMKGKTVLMVAHRLSTVKSADLICVLDHGQIVEQGSHDELMKKDGFYAVLHRTQFATDTASANVILDFEKRRREQVERS